MRSHHLAVGHQHFKPSLTCSLQWHSRLSVLQQCAVRHLSVMLTQRHILLACAADCPCHLTGLSNICRRGVTFLHATPLFGEVARRADVLNSMHRSPATCMHLVKPLICNLHAFGEASHLQPACFSAPVLCSDCAPAAAHTQHKIIANLWVSYWLACLRLSWPVRMRGV